MAEQNKIILDADVKPLKAQLKEATVELQNARAKFGELSTEAVNAAKKVAGIRDSIEGANEQAQLFDPGKRFQALTSAASLAAGAVGAVQGAMGLFGAESEETQKALLKVQSAMALSQGLSQLADLGKVTDELKASFKGLTGTTAQKVAATNADTTAVVTNTVATEAQAVATTGSSLASRAAAISLKVLKGAFFALGLPALLFAFIALVQNFDKIKSAILGASPALKAFADTIGGLIQSFTDFVGVTSEANRELDKLNKSTTKSNEDISNKIKLLSAQGGKETEIYELRRKQINDELALIKQTEATKETLTEDEKKRQTDLLVENAVEAENFRQFNIGKEKEAAEKRATDAATAAEKSKAAKEKMDTETLAAEKVLLDAQNSLKTEREQEAIAIEATFQEQSKQLKKAGIESDGALEEVRRLALEESKKKFDDQDEAKEAAFQERLNTVRTEIRLQGIKDENERARAELLVEQEQRILDITNDTTLEEDQKLALKSELSTRNRIELEALDQSFAEADAAKELEDLDKEIARADLSFAIQKELMDSKQAMLDEQFNAGIISETEYNAANLALTDARISLAEKEAAAKTQLLGMIGQSLTQAADLVGKDTKAGKALGVAGAAINTYQGIAAGVKLGYPLAIPAVAMAAATGFAAVKNILAVKVPGGSGGPSAPSVNMSAPGAMPAVPTLGSSPVTALGAMMQNQPPLRAYVVESEVTGTQKRVADIERRAGF